MLIHCVLRLTIKVRIQLCNTQEDKGRDQIGEDVGDVGDNCGNTNGWLAGGDVLQSASTGSSCFPPERRLFSNCSRQKVTFQLRRDCCIPLLAQSSTLETSVLHVILNGATTQQWLLMNRTDDHAEHVFRMAVLYIDSSTRLSPSLLNSAFTIIHQSLVFINRNLQQEWVRQTQQPTSARRAMKQPLVSLSTRLPRTQRQAQHSILSHRANRPPSCLRP
jgi:hypothetical protein